MNNHNFLAKKALGFNNSKEDIKYSKITIYSKNE